MPRDAALLLEIGDNLRDLGIRNLPDLLQPNDILVFNDTRVITFDEGAREEIIDRALAKQKSVSDICNELFKDYQFGLNLIKTNSGQAEFIIPKAAFDNPDKFLSDWVVRSYPHREGEAPAEPAPNQTTP